jgi:hypothetical protein
MEPAEELRADRRKVHFGKKEKKYVGLPKAFLTQSRMLKP